jgi:hypothetical protein
MATENATTQTMADRSSDAPRSPGPDSQAAGCVRVDNLQKVAW